MAEHSMADVVQKCGGQSMTRLYVSKLLLMRIRISSNDPHQLASHVENANAVSKSSVRSSREDKLGEPELSDSSQPLELRRLNDFP